MQTDASGNATATLTANATGSGAITVTATVNGTPYTCTVTIGVSYALTLTPTNGPAFVSGASSEANIAAALTKNGVAEALPGNLTWTVESSSISAAWWGNRLSGATNGLSWGQSAISLNGTDTQRTDMSGNGGTAPTGATAYLTDIVGSRTVTVKASIVIDGTTVSQTAPVSFGAGPLSVFGTAPTASDRMNWADAGDHCGSAGNLNSAGYQASTKLPTQTQLQNVAGSGSGGKQGAAHAAGWPDDGYGFGWFNYWTGEADGGGGARVVLLYDGGFGWAGATGDNPVAVCLP